MEQNISTVNYTARTLFIKFLDALTLEQLNTIPEGFSNNIIWNIVHIVVTQQLLYYKLSGTPMTISQDIIDNYKKATKPTQHVDQQFVDYIRQELVESLERVNQDIKQSNFGTFTPYMTSTGFEIASLQDAMAFNMLHEGIHLGYIMAQRKLVI